MAISQTLESMANDSEKRFQTIMSKLYHHSPKPTNRPSSFSRVSGDREEGLGKKKKACRPWDRGDLMRRLSSFKAMTWFGKPKVVSPVNCASRGWINVEMDVIVCEACGARLLFSTPFSWSHQQVEKAAAVFSLKLNNGHKLLCPWIDNACDEALALFPPTPPPALVDGYRERFTALKKLTALPVVSSSAIDYMRNTQLEQFLSQPFHSSIILNNSMRLKDGPGSNLEGASENITANMYYQALKIISLCGWEPRLLPYVVDCSNQLSKSSVERCGEEKDSTIVYSSSGFSEVEGGNENCHLIGEVQYDPASVVLDCRLCGACVGLWSFTTIQRPLESFTLIADSNAQNVSATCSEDLVRGAEAPKVYNDKEERCNKRGVDTGCIGSTSRERPLGLNLTIAGGPPPTKQNFRPIVSFPIISRHLRSEFLSGFGVRDYISSKVSIGNQVNASQNYVPPLQQHDTDGSPVVSSEGDESLKRKRSDKESYDDGNDHKGGEKSDDISSEGPCYNAKKINSLHVGTDDIVNSQVILQNGAGDLQKCNTNPQSAEDNSLLREAETADCLIAGDNPCTTSNFNVTTTSSGACQNNLGAELEDTFNSSDNSLSRADSSNLGGAFENNHCDTSHIASGSATKTTLSSDHHRKQGKGDNSDVQNLENTKANSEQTNGVKDSVLACPLREENAEHAPGNKTKLSPYCSEFDPIWQHRPFCPWIASGNGESLPGWKLMLSAIVQQERDSSSDEVQLDSESNLLDEMDDPVVSIRRLFMSSPTKRLKSTR